MTSLPLVRWPTKIYSLKTLQVRSGIHEGYGALCLEFNLKFEPQAHAYTITNQSEVTKPVNQEVTTKWVSWAAKKHSFICEMNVPQSD